MRSKTAASADPVQLKPAAWSRVGVRRASGLLVLFTVMIFTVLPGGTSHAGLAAEEIRLKNGDQLTGHIWRIGPQSLLLETPYATLWIEQIFVDRISVVGVEPRVRVKPKAGEPFEGTLTGATGSELIFRMKDARVRRLPWAEVESVSFYESEKK